MADVFVSYAHANSNRVAPIADGLQASGLSLWWDRRLMPGDDYPNVIERELTDAKSAVVAWSSAARDSVWVRAEANVAYDAGKLVQVRLDTARPPLPFNAMPIHDFTRWGGGGAPPWQAFNQQVRHLTGGAPVPGDERALRGDPLQGMGGHAWFGWLAMALSAGTAYATHLVATDRMSPTLYGQIATAAFGGAVLCLAVTLLRVLQIANASRRP